MKRFLLSILLLCSFTSFAVAQMNAGTTYNPWTGEMDKTINAVNGTVSFEDYNLITTGSGTFGSIYKGTVEISDTTNPSGASLVGYDNTQTLTALSATNVQDALDEIKDEITTITYSANSITTTVGTYNSGDVDSINTIDDADSYSVTEVTGIPAFDVRMDFVNVNTFNEIIAHISYDGSLAHTIRIDLDKTPFDWSNFDTVLADLTNKTGSLQLYTISVLNPNDYLNSGTVRARIYHSSSGNITHNLGIDLFNIRRVSSGGGGVTEHSGLTGLGDDDHTQYWLNDGTRSATGDWDLGSNSLTAGSGTFNSIQISGDSAIYFDDTEQNFMLMNTSSGSLEVWVGGAKVWEFN